MPYLRRTAFEYRDTERDDQHTVTEPDTSLRDALADRYRIGEQIGAGGIATAYVAEDLRHRRRVAIKVLRPELAESLGLI